MDFKVGDLVSRISHKHDIVFKIIKLIDDVAFLKGVDLRLIADSNIDDLVKVNDYVDNDRKIIENNKLDIKIDRSEYFYLPGKILHIDGDNDYLERCMEFYEDMQLKANGLTLNEIDIPNRIYSLLEKYQPDIVIITGHDAYDLKSGDSNNINNYQNTSSFIKAVKEARKYERSQDKLIIIAGACQSNYEELIKAGANFASSPKRINIHALDPAIIASSLALTDKNQNIDLINLLKKTKYGKDGIGGIITKGMMYVGYPR